MFQNVVFAGDCTSNYIEIRTGSLAGRLLKKYCSTNLVPSGNIRSFSNQIFIRFAKGSTASTFTATWTSSDIQCCDKIMLENQAQAQGSRNGEYLWRNSTIYEKTDGSNMLFAATWNGYQSWVVGPTFSSAGLFTWDFATCPEYSRDLWQYWSGNE